MTIAENIISNTSNFESAYISSARQRNTSAPYNLRAWSPSKIGRRRYTWNVSLVKFFRSVLDLDFKYYLNKIIVLSSHMKCLHVGMYDIN